MKKLFAGLLLLLSTAGEAQTFSRYIIKFSNKAHTPYSVTNSHVFLSQRAIDRRTRYGIAIDSTDFPITPRYLDSIRLAGNVTILNASRWLNQVSIQTTDAAALAKIRSFSFVETANPIAARMGGTGGRQETTAPEKQYSNKPFQPTADYYNYGLSFQQVHIHNGEFLHNIGLRGQGMVMGLLDAGFFNYTTLRAFDSINRNGQVLGTHDFVAREASVVEDNSHGMQCLSIIAANIPGQFVGTAPKASFYLYRTEDVSSEYQIEEHNWVCGAERLDSSGGDVLSSSLGYSNDMSHPQFNHTYAEMNGNTTIAARGADLAAKKGMLIVNSAGNQGDDPWRYIATPADGDSVLAVGAVDKNGQVAAFSSYGPSADGQVKPDVVSVGVGTVLQTAGNNVGSGNGTSFSCPNIAGLAACLWQGFPEFNNIKIIDALRRSGSQTATPNNRLGYGIPDMKKAVLLLLADYSAASVTASSCKNTIGWTSKDVQGMRYEVERKLATETAFTKIGEVPAAAAVFGNKTYQFADSLVNVQAGPISYRIRQVIDTALATISAGYIDTVSINLDATCTTTPVSNLQVTAGEYVLMPNPAQNNISLRMNTPTAIPALTLRIVDAKGSVVVEERTSKGAGPASIPLSISKLARGRYFLSVYRGSMRLATREFVKL